MSVITLEGVTDNGQIRLKTKMRLPDNLKVFVVVPDVEVEEVARVSSPRLANPDEARDFEMEVVEDPSGAGL